MTISADAPDQESGADLLLEVERLIAELQGEHGPRVREGVEQLLQHIDAVHRAGLTHLMDAIRGMGGDSFVNRLIADPAIRVLLMSYDLVAVDRRLMAEEALDQVRGHLHAHGIDVEILEVVGGVVYVRVHRTGGSGIPEAAAIRDMEEALRESFVGFQELVTRERQPSTSPVIPLSGLRRARQPVYEDVAASDALPEGGMQTVDAGGHPVLLLRAEGEVFAVINRCPPSPLPLEFSRLEGTTLNCSWHGCRYDVRTGSRLDVQAEKLRVFPAREDAGRILIAVDTAPASGGAA